MDPSLTKNNAADMTTSTTKTDRTGVDLLVSGLLAQMSVPEKPRKAARRPVVQASRAKAPTVAEEQKKPVTGGAGWVGPAAAPLHVCEAAPVTITAPAKACVDDSSAFDMMLPYDYD